MDNQSGGGLEQIQTGGAKVSFFHHMFHLKKAEKCELYNVVQYSILALLPLIVIIRINQNLWPKADQKKGTIELLAEMIGEIAVTSLAVFVVFRVIEYIPTFSGEPLKCINLLTIITTLIVGLPWYDKDSNIGNKAKELHKRIIGQEEAISAVSKAIRRTRSGLKDPKRPSGSFIFLGPSGVGKTGTAKALAEFLFGDEDSLIQIDMSEYMEKHTVSRLIGSPPGYVGYDEGGQLTEAVRRKPFSVVLLDEVEKAHPDVFNTLLQILEDGRLTDAQGRTVDFKNTVIIMTSNLGTKDLSKNIGFSNLDDGGSYEKMKSKVNEELKRYFKPEFLNRIDETIVFHELTLDEVKEIVDLMLDRVHKQLKNSDLEIVLSDEAKEHLATEGYNKEFGARPLRRSIQRLLEDPLSEELLKGKYKAGSTIIVSLDEKDGTLNFEAVEAPNEPQVDFVDTES